ncbi:hypothetical protein [Marmoricola sp. RAF53]|uniref:hypothetical protein n=1 Tax=Marmoricola sp. RAF53 TaxID=3233059 RepID=UPI003F956FA3
MTVSWAVGWRAFWRDPEPVLWPALVAAAGWVLAWVATWIVLGWTVPATRPRVTLGWIAFFLLGQVFWLLLVRAALRARAQPVRRPRTALAAGGVIATALSLSFVLGILGPVLVALLTQFTLVGVLRDGQGVLAALRTSAALAVRSPVRVLAFTGLALVTVLGGAVLGLVGAVPAAAVVALGQLELVPGNRVGP